MFKFFWQLHLYKGSYIFYQPKNFQSSLFWTCGHLSCCYSDPCSCCFSQVGGNNVQTALSLVAYSQDLQKAMEWVFGASFVCRDMDTAKRVTFDQHIMRKSVTLEGDVFDPAGTLSGGIKSLQSLFQYLLLTELRSEIFRSDAFKLLLRDYHFIIATLMNSFSLNS